MEFLYLLIPGVLSAVVKRLIDIQKQNIETGSISPHGGDDPGEDPPPPPPPPPEC